MSRRWLALCRHFLGPNGRCVGAALLLVLGSAAACAQAEPDPPEAEPAWRFNPALEVWGYGTSNQRTSDSLLNPGNRVARLAQNQALLDARLNLRWQTPGVDVLLSPRLLEQQDQIAFSGGNTASVRTGSLRLNQGFMRVQVGTQALTLGRELFTWGPANFRSPSNPFYFDAGRTNPLAAPPGIDLVRSTYSQGNWRATAAYVASTSPLTPALDAGHTVLIKLDQQGSSYLASLIASQGRGDAAFVGGFAQFTPDDAWLVYGEWGEGPSAYQLWPATDTPPPFYTVQQPGLHQRTQLLGASRTLDNGHILAAEYLHNASGYSSAEQGLYFAQARAAAALTHSAQASQAYRALGQALAYAPRLLGRDYLWLSWQSNPQQSALYWRAEWVCQSPDRSCQTLLYLERNFQPRLSGFVSLTHHLGDAQTEYGALLRNRLTLGLKLFAL